MRILGIESSCDETGVAIYDDKEGLISHTLHTQIAMHAEYGGVVPELASRDHIKRVVPLVRLALEKADMKMSELCAIAYTSGPGLIGALLSGAMEAGALAYALGVPCVPVHHMEGHRAVRDADAGVQKAQIIVNFRHRAHGRAWVAGRRLLVDGNGGGQAFDHVHVGLVHLAQELPRIGRKGVDIAPPPLGIDRVERKRRFAGAGKPREYAQRVARDLHIHIFQVVFARTAHEDGISHSCLLPMISLKSYYTTLSGSQQRKFINKCTIFRRPHTPL